MLKRFHIITFSPEPPYFRKLSSGMFFLLMVIAFMLVTLPKSLTGSTVNFFSRHALMIGYYNSMIDNGIDTKMAFFLNGIINIELYITIFYILIRIALEFLLHDTLIGESRYIITLAGCLILSFYPLFSMNIDKTISAFHLSVFHSPLQNILTIGAIMAATGVMLSELICQVISIIYNCKFLNQKPGV